MTAHKSNAPTSLGIRQATADDAPAIAACVEAAYEPWIAVMGMRPGPMNEDYLKVIHRAQVLVVEGKLGIDGVLVLTLEDEGFLLENVAVHPRAMGKGLGSFLLEAAEGQALSQGFTSIYLYTHERMATNIALYRARGYIEFARRTEDGFQRVYMRKNLTAR